MNTLITIMCHGRAQATFDRHWPYWKRHLSDIIAVCPADDVIKAPVFVVSGRSAHHTPDNNKRFKRCIDLFLNLGTYDRLMVLEYDAICMQEVLPLFKAEAVWGNLFTSDETKFQGHHYLHPPIIMVRRVAEQVLDGFSRVPDDVEHCFWDRALGYVCERENIPMQGYGERGFARNTIEESEVEAAAEARRKGAIMFHGVKSPLALAAINTTNP